VNLHSAYFVVHASCSTRKVLRHGSCSVTCKYTKYRYYNLHVLQNEQYINSPFLFLQSYADDSQLYLQYQRQHMRTAGRRLEMCITDVRHWMAANRLKLNADKTELLWAGSTLLGSSGPPLRLGDETVTTSDHVRLLGVTISSDLSPVKHVGTISSSCFYWLRQIRRI